MQVLNGQRPFQVGNIQAGQLRSSFWKSRSFKLKSYYCADSVFKRIPKRQRMLKRLSFSERCT